MEFNDFIDWVKDAEVIQVDGTLCQFIMEHFDDGQPCAIHFGDIGEDIQDIDLDDDIDRFGFSILSAYISDCEIELTNDQYDRPYVVLTDKRCEEDETHRIVRLFQEGY